MNRSSLGLFWLPLVASFLTSFLVTPLTIILAKKIKLEDNPKVHKQAKVVHQYTVPRGGGLPIFLSLLTVFLFLPPDKHLRGIILGATITLIVGLLDDRYEERLSPFLRLITNFLAAGVVVGAGIGIAFITNPLGGVLRLDEPKIIFNFLGETRSIWIIADLFALLWISWCMNFVGWSAGVDGQLPGFVAISAAVIGLLSLRFTGDVTQWPVVILAAITTGAYLGFLPWNFYPQKIIPGYGGKSLAGFLLGVLSILSGAKLATVILVLSVPLIDASYLLFKRISEGRLPVFGGREHLHHRLLDLGWGKRKIALFYWLTSAFFGILALNLNSRQKFYTIILLPALFLVFILWVNFLSTSLKPLDRDSGSKI
jgi:UDP-GlcNAc:undecaprenyl-phosphate GlcNAc-1-phosphate transferase